MHVPRKYRSKQQSYMKMSDVKVKNRYLLTLLLDKSLKIGDKHKPRFISNIAKSRHLETHTVDAIFPLRMYVKVSIASIPPVARIACRPPPVALAPQNKETIGITYPTIIPRYYFPAKV